MGLDRRASAAGCLTRTAHPHCPVDDASAACADETSDSQNFQFEGSTMSLTKENRRADTADGNSGVTGVDAGHDEAQASHVRPRRWHHLRSNRRGDADPMGFDWSWWMVLLVLLLIL